MKRKLQCIVLFMFVFQLGIAQQVPREEVLLEIFTGTW